MSNKFYLGLLLSLFLYTYSFAQVEVSGTCFGGATITLSSIPDINGKPAFQGTGTVNGMPNVQINVAWEPALPGWILYFSGQAFYFDTNDTTLPNNTTAGNWSNSAPLPSPPCPMTDIAITGTSTLPVELTFFQGELRDNMSHLSWQTASEMNNLGFDVERSSDGISWTKLGFVEGAGNSSEILDYQFVDTQPLLGINYYKLRQVDLDGAFEYSDVIKIENKKEDKGTISIFPNPVKDKLNIIGSDFVNAEISIYNQLGKLLKVVRSDTENVEMDIYTLQRGTYIIEVRKENLTFVEKFIKI